MRKSIIQTRKQAEQERRVELVREILKLKKQKQVEYQKLVKETEIRWK